MGEHVVRVTWHHAGEALMVDEVRCQDERQAWRLFQRLCDLLRALVAAEARIAEGGMGHE